MVLGFLQEMCKTFEGNMQDLTDNLVVLFRIAIVSCKILVEILKVWSRFLQDLVRCFWECYKVFLRFVEHLGKVLYSSSLIF